MAELVVDQSNLPGVQEVCQCFAVLEDGALAHNLQEQEIEQYYNSNVERSQLVQSDLRVAKRLQDEEQQRARLIHRQATLQLEEQDSEYARRMQADIQRRAEETRQREKDDEEIAKQIQDEEELRVCQLYEAQMTDRGETASVPPHSTQPTHPVNSEEEEELSDRPSSPSPTTSDYEEDEYCESRRQVYGDRREPGRKGPQAGPPRELRGRSPVRQDCRSSARLGSRTEPFTGGWGHVVRLIKSDMSEQGYLSCTSEDEPFEPVYRLEKILKRCQLNPGQSPERGEGLPRHHSSRDGHGETWQEERAGRAERSRPSEDGDGRRAGSENRRVKCCSRSCRDSGSGDAQRRVHFQDDSRRCNTYDVSRREYEGNHATSQAVWSHTVSSYPANGRSQTCCPAANGDQYQLRPRSLEQGTRLRHVYRDVGSRASGRVANRTQSPEAAQQAYRVRHFVNTPQHPVARVVVEGEEEIEGPGSFRDQGRWEGKSRRAHREIGCRADSLREERTWERREDRCYRDGNGRRRTWSEPWRGHEENGSSTEDEEVERERRRRRRRRREEKRARVVPQRSLSLWYSGRSPGAVPGLQRARVSLDLGDLEQVLLDEELARRLQAEEEELIRRDAPSISPSQERCPDGDFTVAQVAQDEEIAHYIQNQEMEGHQRPRALDNAGWEEGGGTDPYDEGIDFERQRERLDSEGLLSPSEVCSPEFLPSSAGTMATQQQQFRNVAEDLDPTYQRKENVQTGENIPGACPVQASPAFVTPTKRHSDKEGRVKSREKKENTKPKEGCKQQ